MDEFERKRLVLLGADQTIILKSKWDSSKNTCFHGLKRHFQGQNDHCKEQEVPEVRIPLFARLRFNPNK